MVTNDATGSGSATMAQLRADIDGGLTRDKVCWSDPAAAPLGTDEEAAGTPCSREAIALARQYEIGRAERIAEGKRHGRAWIYVGGAAVAFMLAWLVAR